MVGFSSDECLIDFPNWCACTSSHLGHWHAARGVVRGVAESAAHRPQHCRQRREERRGCPPPLQHPRPGVPELSGQCAGCLDRWLVRKPPEKHDAKKSGKRSLCVGEDLEISFQKHSFAGMVGKK